MESNKVITLMELEISWLLNATWILGTFPILISLLPFSYLNSYHRVLLGFAKRGKIMQSPSRFTVPQRLFLHFYMVAVAWTFLLLVMIWFYASKLAPMGSGSLDLSTAASHLTGGSHGLFLHKSHFLTVELRYKVWQSVFLLLLMEIHVLRRLFETIYIFKYSSSARMHILGYITGLYFYVAAPLSLCHSYVSKALYFAAEQAVEMNVKGQSALSLSDFNWHAYAKPLTKLGWCQWAGAVLFAWGWVHQHRCHVILGALRRHSRQGNEYMIPHSDWFEMVSSPHYLAEIIIYAGLLVASEGTNTTVWLLLLFVMVNLSLAAAETQRWYHRKFEDYPRNRWAVVPFIY